MADPANSPLLTRSSIVDALQLISTHVHTTPVLTNSTLTNLASTPQSPTALIGTQWQDQTPAAPKIRLWFKCENLQRVGAFKARGAFHALKRLVQEVGEEDVRARGIVTHSSGNHAQATSLAAKELGIPVTIVMPMISTPTKIAATKGYGAKVLFSGSTSEEREKVVNEVIEETGARLVPPYDHPDIMLGQGTLGLEFQDQVEKMMEVAGAAKRKKGLDAIITPCGGGGMLSGVAISCEGTGISVFGAEPSFQGADDCKRGLAAGKRIETVKTLTIADGLRTPVGAWPWSIISNPAFVKAMYSVTEEQIKAALRLVMERMKVVVEPSAVVPLAVCLFNEDFRHMVEREGGEDGWDIGIVFSGGNTSMEAIAKMFADGS